MICQEEEEASRVSAGYPDSPPWLFSHPQENQAAAAGGPEAAGQA